MRGGKAWEEKEEYSVEEITIYKIHSQTIWNNGSTRGFAEDTDVSLPSRGHLLGKYNANQFIPHYFK